MSVRELREGKAAGDTCEMVWRGFGEGLRWPPVCGGRGRCGLVSLAPPTVIWSGCRCGVWRVRGG